ncbi:MAG: histidinol-phosphatase [Acidobacteria bacterium]|nr:histidinol-phosphatase [Acidobacteriota bacterium]
MTKRVLLLFAAVATFAMGVSQGQVTRARSPIRIPDIPGYRTLKCDFHVHTVFSDGNVWPQIRAEEAWRQGLDAIAITDHIEYQPHKDDLPINHERSFEIAKIHGDDLGVLVLKGSEVTRKMPPGHFNAVFLKSSRVLDVEDWRDALRLAAGQGAFIFWNHPGWTGQQPDGISRWYPEHTELLEKGQLHGIEVVNGQDYYPEVHRWCLEKNLTMLGNSDIHDPAGLVWETGTVGGRPLTLVFATDRTPEAIREALFARRTAVAVNGMLIGRKEYLEPIFKGSIEVLNPSVTVRGKRSAFVQISNVSDIDYDLSGEEQFEEVSVPSRLVLKGGKTVLLQLQGKSETLDMKKTFDLRYVVTNLKITPDAGLEVTFPVSVTFAPE